MGIRTLTLGRHALNHHHGDDPGLTEDGTLMATAMGVWLSKRIFFDSQTTIFLGSPSHRVYETFTHMITGRISTSDFGVLSKHPELYVSHRAGHILSVTEVCTLIEKFRNHQNLVVLTHHQVVTREILRKISGHLGKKINPEHIPSGKLIAGSMLHANFSDGSVELYGGTAVE